MKIEKVKIEDILLDEKNPRFEKQLIRGTQAEIMNMLLNKKQAKELISSMKLGVIWNPYIIVTKLSEEEAIQTGKLYKLVEGNTRTAILKAGHIEQFTEESKIPVQVLKIEDFESEEQMRDVIAKIQGRTHVMGVKPWNEAAQAKHVYLMVANYRKSLPGYKINHIYVKVANELALDAKKVRTMAQRYRIFSEINELSDELTNEEWSFLEAIDTTSKTRRFFGFQDDELDFEWNDNSDYLVNPYEDDHVQIRKELLIAIPALIRKARLESTLSKSFRDTMNKLIDGGQSNLEEVKRKIDEVITNKVTYTILAKELTQGSEEKEQWFRKLDNLLDGLANTPVVQDWSHELLPKLKKIERVAKQLHTAIGLKQDDE